MITTYNSFANYVNNFSTGVNRPLWVNSSQDTSIYGISNNLLNFEHNYSSENNLRIPVNSILNIPSETISVNPDMAEQSHSTTITTAIQPVCGQINSSDNTSDNLSNINQSENSALLSNITAEIIDEVK